MNNIKELNLGKHMTMNYLNHTRKGQSAIEYLTTYGWMLLVVAIVGGAIFTTVQGQSNIQNSSGLANADVQIANFGITGGSGSEALSIELRSAAQDQVEITKINISEQGDNPDSVAYTGDGSADGQFDGGDNVVIPVGDTHTFTINEFNNSDTQNTFDIEITYNTGGLDDLQVSGTFTGQMEMNP
jgi:hypothetical protein